MPKRPKTKAKAMMKARGFAGDISICQPEQQGKGFHIEFEIWTSEFNLLYLNRLASTFATTNLEVSLGSGCDCGCGGESTVVLRNASISHASK